jgi:superfamily II DNA/RNA helicase
MLTTFMMNEGINADAIHSDRSQGAREKALARFRAGKVTCLVATDIAGKQSLSQLVRSSVDLIWHRSARLGYSFCCPCHQL